MLCSRYEKDNCGGNGLLSSMKQKNHLIMELGSLHCLSPVTCVREKAVQTEYMWWEAGLAAVESQVNSCGS